MCGGTRRDECCTEKRRERSVFYRSVVFSTFGGGKRTAERSDRRRWVHPPTVRAYIEGGAERERERRCEPDPFHVSIFCSIFRTEGELSEELKREHMKKGKEKRREEREREGELKTL
jgi:hypothetical protein